MNKTKARRGDQQGFVSLVVALTLVIILALLTVGFTQLSRHEQQRSLDKQLSVQANYAAESGINDTIKQINASKILPTNNPNKCLKFLPNNSDINTSVSVAYTCLLVNLQPPSLLFSNVGVDSDRTITFSTVNPPKRLVISWGSTDTTRVTWQPISFKFPPKMSWTHTPAVLQFGVTPYANFTRSALIANTFTSYLYPTPPPEVGGTYHDGISDTNGDGPVLSGGCNPAGVGRSVTYPCSVTITGLNDSSGPPDSYKGPFLVHFLNHYDASNVRITAFDSGGTATNFQNGQAVIDSTGKAQDVLKRLQVRISIGGNSGGVTGSGLELPNYTLEAQNLCKRFGTMPSPPGTTTFDGLGSSCTLNP